MSPAVPIISFVLGLILTTILKPDLPRDLPPLAVVIDNMARLSAFVLAVGLLGLIAEVEFTDDEWTPNVLSSAALLALWMLAILAGSFFVLAWHRLRVAVGGSSGTEWPTPAVAAGLHLVSMFAAGVIGYFLLQFAMVYSDPTFASLLSWLSTGTLLAWSGIVIAAWALHRVQVWQEGFLPTSWQLARALAGEHGAWYRVRVVAIADDAASSLIAAVWIQAGQWFWRTQDVTQLVRFRNAAATRATYPTMELHGRRMTFRGALGPKRRRPWRHFGVHVSERTKMWPRAARRRAVGFQPSEFGALPREAWGLLVPIDASTLRSVGLIANVETSATDSTEQTKVLTAA